MIDELRRNLDEVRLNLKRVKNNPESIITQERFEELFFEGWNRGSKEVYIKTSTGRWIKE